MKSVILKTCLVITAVLILAGPGIVFHAQDSSKGSTGTTPIVINPNPDPEPIPLPTTWDKVYTHSKTQDVRDICMTLDGTGYLMTGRSYSPMQPFLMKVSAKGGELWYNEYGPWSYYDAAWCITAVSDNGFVMGGKVQYTIGGDDDDILVLKANSSGTQVWKREIDIAGYFDRMWDIVELPDGSLVGCGTMSQEPVHHDAGLIKMTSAGIESWRQLYGQSGTTEVAKALTATSDGGFLIGGYYGWTTNPAAMYCQMYVIKTDASGNPEWSKTFGDMNGWNEALWVGETSCGNYYVAGRTGVVSGGTDAWVLKLSAAGEIIWEKTFNGNYDDWFRGGLVKDDNSVILVGLTQSYSANPGTGTTNRDGWIVKMHPDGHMLWQENYGASGVKEELADVAGPTSDNRFVAGGNSGGNAYLVKFADNVKDRVDNIDTGQTYSSIQAAINGASAGDTLSVHAGTYNENITVNKALTIIGENKDTTFITGAETADAVLVSAGGVTVKGFTISIDYVSQYSYGPPFAGVKIVSGAQNTVIAGNHIKDCYRAFFLSGGGATGTVIKNNLVSNDVDDEPAYFYSFWISGSSGNTIYGNTISSSHYGGCGIYLGASSDNAIYANDISGNHTGIYLVSSSNNNMIHHNNFDNQINAEIENYMGACTGNQWFLSLGISSGGNYWANHTCVDADNDDVCDDPYVIPGGNGDQDDYPLTGHWEPICGNINGEPDGGMNIADVTYLISYLYHGGMDPVPPCAADVNGDGQIDDDDIDYLVAYIFEGGPPPVQNCCCN